MKKVDKSGDDDNVDDEGDDDVADSDDEDDDEVVEYGNPHMTE